MKFNTRLTIVAFSIALSATFLTRAAEPALFATAYGDNPAVAGMCNPGTMPNGACTTTPTTFGFCTVTFSSGVTDNARVAGCAAFYYKTTP